MEKENIIRKNNKGILSVLLVIILVLVGILIYFDFIEKNDANQNTNNYEYKVLNDDDNLNYYLVKANDDNYEVVYDLSSYHAIGVVNDKFYFSNDESIMYFDLKSNNFNPINWVFLPLPSINKNSDEHYSYNINKSMIIGDEIYFSFNTSTCDNKYCGIMSLNTNAKDFSEYKQVIPTASTPSDWYYDGNNLIVYKSDNMLYKYNIKTGSSEQLVSKKQYQLNNYIDNKGNLIYYDYDRSALYTININTKKSVLVSNGINLNKSLSEWFSDGLACVNDGYIYYAGKDNKIYKYNINDNTNNVLYTIDDISNYKGLYCIDKDTIKLRYFNNTAYVSNGNKVNSIGSVLVKMLDGKTKVFSINNLK